MLLTVEQARILAKQLQSGPTKDNLVLAAECADYLAKGYKAMIAPTGDVRLLATSLRVTDLLVSSMSALINSFKAMPHILAAEFVVEIAVVVKKMAVLEALVLERNTKVHERYTGEAPLTTTQMDEMIAELEVMGAELQGLRTSRTWTEAFNDNVTVHVVDLTNSGSIDLHGVVGSVDEPPQPILH